MEEGHRGKPLGKDLGEVRDENKGIDLGGKFLGEVALLNGGEMVKGV